MAQSNAARQKAYRHRRAERNRIRKEYGFPPAPPKSTRPDFIRWRQITEQLQAAATALAGELEAYIDDRSPAWREGPRGEHLLAQLELVQAIGNQADELTWEYPE